MQTRVSVCSSVCNVTHTNGVPTQDGTETDRGAEEGGSEEGAKFSSIIRPFNQTAEEEEEEEDSKIAHCLPSVRPSFNLPFLPRRPGWE